MKERVRMMKDNILVNVNIFITIAGAVITMLSVIMGQQDELDDDYTLVWLTSPNFDLSCAGFVYVVLVPFTDLLVEVPEKLYIFFSGSNSHSKLADANSTIVRLTDFERFLYIIGMASMSTITMVSPSSSQLYVLYNSLTDFASILTLCPIMIFLQRCTELWKPWGLVVNILIIIGSIFDAIDTVYGETYLNMAAYFYDASLIVYGLVSFYGLYSFVRERPEWVSRKNIMRFWWSEASFEANPEGPTIDELYSVWVPTLHMIVMGVALLMNDIWYHVDGNIFDLIHLWNYTTMVSGIFVLVIEIRIRKNEVTRGLVSRGFVDICRLCPRVFL
jgi:hypothetical protein